MRIGIITFHCAHNYGAMLQCFALQESLRSMGHDVFVIDYRPEVLTKGYVMHSVHHWLSPNPLRLAKRLCTEPFKFRMRELRWNAFNNFMQQRLNLYSFNPSSNFKDFDLMLFGSDQIWNKHLTEGIWDTTYLGQGFDCPKASYAASMGAAKLDEESQKLLSTCLSGFKAVSVRETSLKIALQPLLSKEVKVVCDPVLLLSKDFWEAQCIPVTHEKPYVLCYNLLMSKACRQQAEAIARERGWDVIEITREVFPFRSKKKCLQHLTPIEFISYFKEASFVVTSSFHGTAFSLLFRKNFYAIGMGTLSDRAASLLKKVGMEERMHEEPVQEVKPCDYETEADEKLNLYRQESLSFLRQL